MFDPAIGWHALAVGYPAMGLVAGVAVGLLAGAATWALVTALDLSDAPPRLVAAAVLRRPAGSLPPRAVAVGHLAWGLALLVVVWVGGLALGRLRADGPSAAVALATLGLSWWLVAARLPAGREDVLDRPPRRVRREWAVVHAAFALAAVVAFPAVYYVLLAVVFPPSG